MLCWTHRGLLSRSQSRLDSWASGRFPGGTDSGLSARFETGMDSRSDSPLGGRHGWSLCGIRSRRQGNTWSANENLFC